MKNLKKLTILHSNDMHGDFLAEHVENRLVGGVARLSGYIRKVREEEENVIYAIAGDMFRGSVIDHEFFGLSTIEITNMLQPDVVTIGNHEADYGLSHLLFIEKCARFPIINANLYIKTNGARLFKPYHVIEIDGMNILCIGIVTKEVLNSTRNDEMIGTIIDTADAAREIEKICNAHRGIDIDFTICLTHIGYEEDIKLAKMLDPAVGVDIIIGGHSHTFLKEATVVNGIPIVQAGTGTDEIGRFDIMVDTDNNCIDSYTWKPIPIDSSTCPEDEELLDLLNKYKDQTDKKYARILTRFRRRLTHPARNQETEVGDLFADIFKKQTGVDVVFVGSGSIRKTYLGPIVDLAKLKEAFPYDDALYMMRIEGRTLKDIIRYVYCDKFVSGEIEEAYQFNRELRIVYSKSKHEVVEMKYKGQDIDDDKIYTFAMQKFHYSNMESFVGLSNELASKFAKPQIVATSTTDILIEYFEEHQAINVRVDGRISVID